MKYRKKPVVIEREGMGIRKLIKKSCLYVNSKCSDRDADVTMLIKEIKEGRITIQEIRGAVARGWCTKRNENKEMDSDLAEDISQEVFKLREGK